MSNVKMIPFKMTIGDKEVEAFIKEDDYKEVMNQIEPPKKKTGYERANDGGIYFYVDTDGTVDDYYDDRVDNGSQVDYDAGNYYTSEEVAENNARADKLMRLLRRFAVEHREHDVDWNNKNQNKCYIYYDYINNQLYVSSSCYTTRYFNDIYFDSRENVQLAIETFRDELIWYFTEYKDSL